MNSIDSNAYQLLMRALGKFLVAFIILGGLFFGCAGTFSYINGWVYLGTIVATLGLGLSTLCRKDKSLLEKRIKTKETDPRQKRFVRISVVLITCIYGLPGLDFRFHWSSVPLAVMIVGEVILLLGYGINLKVMMINSYASRVVEIQDDQNVIDTGLYAVVRHPMYMAIMLVYIGTCLVLASYVALIPCGMMMMVLGKRAINEEKTLMDGLPGYAEYMEKVKHRIVPYIW